MNENSGTITSLYAEFTPTTDVPIGGMVVLSFPNKNPDFSVNWWGNLGIASAANPVSC